MEEWRMIKNSTRHAVSNTGRVLRFVGEGVPELTSSFLNWKELIPHASGNYLKVGIDIHGKSVTKAVHRLVAETFLGESDLEVNHKDCNPKNNHLSNLEWLSHRDNIRHAYKHGRCFNENDEWRGRKLLSKDIVEIKKLHLSGWTHQKIADRYNVSRVLITRILNNKAWVVDEE